MDGLSLIVVFVIGCSLLGVVWEWYLTAICHVSDGIWFALHLQPDLQTHWAPAWFRLTVFAIVSVVLLYLFVKDEFNDK